MVSTIHPTRNELLEGFMQIGKYALRHKQKAFPYTYTAAANKQQNRNLQTIWDNQVTLADLEYATENLYILNIPFCPGKNLDCAKARWKHLTKIIQEQSFGTTKEESEFLVARRVFVNIGMNRATSVSIQDDEAFDNWVRSLRTSRLGFNCRIISTLWQTTFTDGTKAKVVQLGFLVLEYLSTELATKVKTHFEEEQRDSLRKQIPFQYIREWIWTDTRQQPNFQSLLHNRTVYLNTLDDDTIGLRFDQGALFSAYDSLIAGTPKEAPPQLMSTGYFASADAPLLTQVALFIDMCIREAVARYIPGGTYPPEPNTAILLNDLKIRKAISFVSKINGLDSENRRLLSNIRSHLNPKRVYIVAQRCLLTTIPERMEASKKKKELTIKTVGQVQVLKALRGISQSHADHMLLGNNVFPALPLPEGSSEHKITQQKFNSYFSEILKAFDPISLTRSWPKGGERYTNHCFQIMLEVYPLWRTSLLDAWKDPRELNRRKREWSTLMESVALKVGEKRKKSPTITIVIPGPQATSKEKYSDAFQAMFEALNEKVDAIATKGHFSSKTCKKLVKAAAAAGDAIYRNLAAIEA